MQSWIHALEWQARLRPGLTAYSDASGDQVTFAGLLERVEQGAARWSTAGVADGDRVLIVLRNSVEYVVQVLAVQRAGGIPTLLNWRLAAPEFAALIELFGPRAVVAEPEFAGTVEQALAGSDGRSATVRVLLGGERAGWIAPDMLDGPVPERPVAALQGGAVCVLLHTSGTTGTPKGIPLTHRAVIDGLTFSGLIAGMRPGGRHLRFNPMFHFAGLAGTLLGIVTAGHVHLLPAFDAALWLDLVEAMRIEYSNAPPVVMRRLVDEWDRRADKPDLSSLQEIWYGTAPISPDLLERAIPIFGCGFRQNYGQTESSTPVTQLAPDDHVPGSPRLASAGRLQPFFDLRIVDPTTGTDVGDGEPGELWIRGDALFPGYWNDPARTAEAFVGDGWYRTGDIGRLDTDGYLFILDRARDMVVTGGENVYPTEVEMVLARHPDVAEIAVIGIPSEAWGETLCAIAVPRPGAELDGASLIAWARERLAHFKCPTVVEIRTVLPRNETGKVLRRLLREPFWAGRDRAVS
jgi:acyl-CoA synthetase (AMP-forming)/AMP-acid ligase II